MNRLRSSLSYSNVMSTIAVFALVGGGAFAIGAIPDKNGQINACFVKRGKNAGDVRLLVKGTKCRRGERKIAWNQKGVAGPAGPAGAPNPNAADSNLLDNLDSTAFLRSDATAAGDLTGAFPAPQISDNAIGGLETTVDPDDEIADGSIDSDDVAPNSLNATHIVGLGLNADLVDSMDTESRVHRVAAASQAEPLFSPQMPLTLNCDPSALASMSVRNATGGLVAVFIDTGAADPIASILSDGQSASLSTGAVSSTDLITWHVASRSDLASRVATYVVGLDEDGPYCTFYVRGFWTE